uniref:Integrase catalytic domain-containing protein n=1 Tax=Haemonchus contortus TaxID=6289 RepID=A0A7I5E9A8_HAECO
MGVDIEKLVRNCRKSCEGRAPILAEATHFVGSSACRLRRTLDGNFYLIIVSGFSKCEMIHMNQIPTSATIKVLTKVSHKSANTHHGQRHPVHFSSICGFPPHVRSHPFHSQSNEQAERIVDTFESGLTKSKREERQKQFGLI